MILNSFFAPFRKGTNHSEFLLCFLQINEKETRVSEFCFSFCSGKEKGSMPPEFDFSFPGRSKYDEIS